MRQLKTWYAAQPRGLRVLLAINVVAYLLWQVVLIHIAPAREFVWAHLALNPDLPGLLFEPWQLLTYGFLHLQPGLPGLLHVLFNMLWLVWIGRDLEELQGPGRLVGLYVLGAIGGALLTAIMHGAFPGAMLFSGIVHGASGAVLAVMAGVAFLYPYKQISLMLLGTVRLVHLVLGFLALDILFLAAGGTSVSAHWGGALTGFGFARLQQRGVDLTGWASVFFQDRTSGRRRSGSGGRGGSPTGSRGILHALDAWLARRTEEKSTGGRRKGGSAQKSTFDSSRPGPRVSPDASSRTGSGGGSVLESKTGRSRVSSDPRGGAGKEIASSALVDQILDKISDGGYESLTAEEKRVLLEASRRDSQED